MLENKLDWTAKDICELFKMFNGDKCSIIPLFLWVVKYDNRIEFQDENGLHGNDDSEQTLQSLLEEMSDIWGESVDELISQLV